MDRQAFEKLLNDAGNATTGHASGHKPDLTELWFKQEDRSRVPAPTVVTPAIPQAPPPPLHRTDSSSPGPGGGLHAPATDAGTSGGNPPPVLGLPPVVREPDPPKVETKPTRQTRPRPDSRAQAMADSRQQEADNGWSGVQASRLLQTVVDLLSARGAEAVAAYVRERLQKMQMTYGEDAASGGNVTVEAKGGKASAPPLMFVAHLDADDPPLPTVMEMSGSVLRLKGNGVGLHGRAGVAVLLEFLEVVAEVGRQEKRLPRRDARVVFTVEGDGAHGGVRRLANIGGVQAAFFLDGFLVDEAIEVVPATDGPLMSARATRRMTERALASKTNSRLAGDLSGPVRMVERCLTRIGLPLWLGRMEAAGSGASVLLARGVPSTVIGTGVAGGYASDEAFYLQDAVLCARLLMALTSL